MSSGRLTAFSVFVSCPRDMTRHVSLAEDVASANNRRWERGASATVRVLSLKDAASMYSPRGSQDAIDKEFFGRFQVFFGIMGLRFGTATAEYGCGTEHEYRKAVENHLKFGSPAYIKFGFCEEPVNPFEIDTEEFAKVRAWRQEIGQKQLYCSWRSDSEFKERFVEDIDKAIHEYASNVGRHIPGGLRYS